MGLRVSVGRGMRTCHAVETDNVRVLQRTQQRRLSLQRQWVPVTGL